MKKFIFTFLILSIFIIQNCSSEETKYFVTYNKNTRIFSDEINKDAIKGINYYVVQYNNDKITSFSYFEDGKLKSKHNITYNSNKFNEQKNYNSFDELISTEYFGDDNRLYQKYFYNIDQKLSKQEFYRVAPGEAKISVLVREIKYKYIDDQTIKRIFYYIYFEDGESQLRRSRNKIEEYQEDKLIGELIYHHNDRGQKIKREYFKNGKLTKISYFNEKEAYIEEEEILDENGKVIKKIYLDKSGQEINKK